MCVCTQVDQWQTWLIQFSSARSPLVSNARENVKHDRSIAPDWQHPGGNWQAGSWQTGSGCGGYDGGFDSGDSWWCGDDCWSGAGGSAEGDT